MNTYAELKHDIALLVELLRVERSPNEETAAVQDAARALLLRRIQEHPEFVLQLLVERGKV